VGKESVRPAAGPTQVPVSAEVQSAFFIVAASYFYFGYAFAFSFVGLCGKEWDRVMGWSLFP